MSGQSKYRSLWERYYADCHGVVFVIDSSDTMRMAVASNELQLLIQHPEMVKNRSTTIQQGVPILILANKSDLDMAIPIGQVKKPTECPAWRHDILEFSGLLLLFFPPFSRHKDIYFLWSHDKVSLLRQQTIVAGSAILFS